MAALSERIVQLWGQFARTGDPNPAQEEVEGELGSGQEKVEGPVRWPEFQGPDWQYLALEDGSGGRVAGELRGRVCMFWQQVATVLHCSVVYCTVQVLPGLLPARPDPPSSRSDIALDTSCRKVLDCTEDILTVVFPAGGGDGAPLLPRLPGPGEALVRQKTLLPLLPLLLIRIAESPFRLVRIKLLFMML